MKFASLMAEVLERINSLYILLGVRMVGFFVGVLFWLHFSSCLWFWIGTRNEGGWVMIRDIDMLPFITQYFMSMNWSVAQLQGSTDITPGDSAVERAFATLATLCSVVILAAFVSKLTNVLHQLTEIRDQRFRQMREVCNFLCQHHISAELSLRVRKSAEISQKTYSSGSQKGYDVLLVLPVELRRLVIEESLAPFLMGNP